MTNIIKKCLKAIIEDIIIAFFFVTIIYIIFNLTIKDEVQTKVNLVNTMAVNSIIKNNEDINLDKATNKLSSYPAYGQKFAIMRIPSINVEAPVSEGDSLKIIKKTIGHYEGSYFPGENGSIILAAHNSEEHFKKIPKIKIDDYVYLDTIYGNFKYKVYKTDIIKAVNYELLPIQHDEEILMFYTCYPVDVFGFKDKRYVVYAKLESDNI